MSTEVLEPPKVETKVETPAPSEGLLASIKKAQDKRVESAPNSRSIADIKAAEKKAATQKVEEKPPVTEEKKPDAVVTTDAVKPDDKEKNFAALRQAREAAEKERDELKQKYELLSQEHETYKTRPESTEVEKERERLNGEIKKYQTELKAAAITRDPDFQQQFDAGILRKQKQMISILSASGVNDAEAQQAVAQWNKGKFGEYIETLPVLQQGEFASLVRGAEELAHERNDAIANAEKTYEEREKLRKTENEKQQAQFKGSLKAEALEVINEMVGLDGIKDNEELTSLIRTSVMKAAPIEEGHMTRKEVFHRVAQSVALAYIADSQQKEIESGRTKIAELEKKVAEQEEFITKRGGAIPKPGNGSTVQAGTKEPSLLMGIVKKYSVTQNS